MSTICQGPFIGIETIQKDDYLQNVREPKQSNEEHCWGFGMRRNGASLLKLWPVGKCLEIFDVFDGQDALAYWISGRFPS